MCALRLPEEAPDVLNRNWPSGVRKSAPSKWLICCTDSVPQQAKEMYHAAMEAKVDNGAMLDQTTRDRSNFLKLAKQDFSAPDVQHILDQDQLFAHPQQTSSEDWETYFYGFIVVTAADWKEQGVTAVHCDEDRGKWKVTRCNIPLHELAELYSVMELDITFDEVREQFDSALRLPENAATIFSLHWPTPVYKDSPCLK